MKKIAIQFVLLVSFAQVCFASNPTLKLSEESYLRKLSFSIRGLPPTAAEYNDLKTALLKSSVDRFFAYKTREYLASEYHIRKMTVRLEELFKLQPTPWVIPPTADERESSNLIPISERNSLNEL